MSNARRHRARGAELPGALGPLLRLPYQAWVARRHAVLAEAGYLDVRPAHGLVFQHLPPEGARVTELAARAGVTKQHLSLLVEELEELGYLERVADPADKRVRIVRLTARGEALVDRVRQVNARIEAEWADRFGAPRLEVLRRELQDLIRALDLAE